MISCVELFFPDREDQDEKSSLRLKRRHLRDNSNPLDMPEEE